MKQATSKFGTAKTIGPSLGVFLVALLMAGALRAEVRATLDRATIYDGDTVTLTIEASGKDQGGSPDLSGLEKDFVILGTSTSQQIRIVNGKRSDKRQWLVELDPRQPGTYTLPALRIGDAQTQPLTLKVTEQPPAVAGAADRPVYLKTEIQSLDSAPLVQQQVLYTMRLYYRVPLIEGSFDDPRPADAVVERLGQDKQYKTTVNGQHYQVLERRYAIFPEKSGTLTIPPMTFTGRTMSASSRGSSSSGMDSMMERFFGGNPFNDSFFAGTPFGDPGQRIRVRSEPLSLEVEARPSGFRGKHWLPAQQLMLHDSWADRPPVFQVGEPVTRTIRLEAKGLAASQLPPVEIEQMDNMRLYPEQPAGRNRTDGNWVFGTRSQSIAYVPSADGKLSIPEIRINWWDVTRQENRSAVLPAWEVNVAPAPAASVSARPLLPATDPMAARIRDDGPADAAQEEVTSSRIAEFVQKWRWPAAGFTVLAAALLIVGLGRHRRSQTAAAGTAQTSLADPAPHLDTTHRTGQARAALQTACTINDPQAAAHALLAWAEAEWPDNPPRNLSALAQRLSAGGDAIRELNQALYGAGRHAWQGRSLWEACQHGLHVKTQGDAPAEERLSPLYPRWSQTR